ncbi:hypothetical protein [Planktothrix sp. FACHB-1355]|nr:hypothetical protein [Planktothrix sp. FACHB-1355]
MGSPAPGRGITPFSLKEYVCFGGSGGAGEWGRKEQQVTCDR